MSKEIKHWASNLEAGDRVTATIRHESDGSLNQFDVPVIVVSVHADFIMGSVESDAIEIPFNELNKPPVAAPSHPPTAPGKELFEWVKAKVGDVENIPVSWHLVPVRFIHTKMPILNIEQMLLDRPNSTLYLIEWLSPVRRVEYGMCPKCSGEGWLFETGTSSSITKQCDYCNGTKTVVTAATLPQGTPVEEGGEDIYDSVYMDVVRLVEGDNIQGDAYSETVEKLKTKYLIKLKKS